MFNLERLKVDEYVKREPKFLFKVKDDRKGQQEQRHGVFFANKRGLIKQQSSILKQES